MLTLSGAGQPQNGVGIEERFVISVKTDNAGTSLDNQFTLPTNGSGYNYDIKYDGQTLTGQTGSVTLTFPSGPGTYDVKISGSFPQCYFNNVGDRLKLLDIKNFGIYALGSTNQIRAFLNCSNMAISAQDIGNFENVSNFADLFSKCANITTFPLIDTSNGDSFFKSWYGLSSMTSFPSINISNGSNFNQSWRNCSSLTTFPSNAFDTSTANDYNGAFTNTNLTTQSIDNILVSIDTSGTINGTFTQSGGEGPSYVGSAAISSLVAKGWTIVTVAPVVTPEFIISVKTDNAGTSADNQFTIPTRPVGFTYDYNVVTSDGQTFSNLTGNKTITFPIAGTRKIRS